MRIVKLMLVRDRRRKAIPVESPKDAVDYIRRQAKGADREMLFRIDLDSRNVAVGFEVVSVGTATASLVHPREFYKGALLSNAFGVIALHNHPSQQADPSPEDRATTRRLKSAGEILGVNLIDHVILTDDAFFSFREAGLL